MRTPSATASPPPMSATAPAAVLSEMLSVPATIRLWWSCAMVDAIAPRRNPNPCTNPLPTRPVAMCRSITAILMMSRSMSGVAKPDVEGIEARDLQ